MKRITTLALLTYGLLGCAESRIMAANDLLDWRHDLVSGLHPNSRGVDVDNNDNGDVLTAAYTTTGLDEKWLITRHDNITGGVGK